jgi:hypothetical protein
VLAVRAGMEVIDELRSMFSVDVAEGEEGCF